jgi:biofilm PGA synthesis N-glycosyltransferase PgaC
MPITEALARPSHGDARRGRGCTYVLVTPARNEAKYIELTIQSVVNQTARPAKWVIVSDGSTDGTDDVVKDYAARHDWIELLRVSERRERHFAGKVQAFYAGYARMVDVTYDIVGNLDADVSIDDPDYFAFLMRTFEANSTLGIAGTSYQEGTIVYPYRHASTTDVAGACQMFRRECFQAIGGYPAIESGGIDVVVVLRAQAEGWQTRTFTEKTFLHHRTVGSAHCVSTCQRLLQNGQKDYRLGSHPAIVLLRSVRQMTSRPPVIGGVLVLAGYMWATLCRVERAIPEQLIELRRNDQLRRLKAFLRRAVCFGS